MSQSQSPTADSNPKKPLFMVWTAPAFLMSETGGFLVSAAAHLEGLTPPAPASPAAQPPAGGTINPETQVPGCSFNPESSNLFTISNNEELSC
jgi:hypothetical protein